MSHFQVPPGSVCCLIGANGSGKTTLMRTILGVLSPLHGDILLDGIAINHLNDRQRAAAIAQVPQAHDGAFAFTALDMVMMGLAPQLAAFAVPGLKNTKLLISNWRCWGSLTGAPALEHSERRRAPTGIDCPRSGATSAPLLLDEPASSPDFGHQIRLLDTLVTLKIRVWPC